MLSSLCYRGDARRFMKSSRRAAIWLYENRIRISWYRSGSDIIALNPISPFKFIPTFNENIKRWENGQMTGPVWFLLLSSCETYSGYLVPFPSQILQAWTHHKKTEKEKKKEIKYLKNKKQCLRKRRTDGAIFSTFSYSFQSAKLELLVGENGPLMIQVNDTMIRIMPLHLTDNTI